MDSHDHFALILQIIRELEPIGKPLFVIEILLCEFWSV